MSGHFQKFIKSLLFFFFFSSLSAEKVAVDASINQNQGWANEKLVGSITLSHSENDSIDEKSFELEGKPLLVHRVQEVPMTIGKGKTIVSIYSFELPPKATGLYILGPISVRVGENIYQSLRATYQVVDTPHEKRATTTEETSTERSELAKDIILSLDRIVEIPTPFFPGQRGKFIYRISYNRSVDLTSSVLPLFDVADDFQKIGDIHFKDYQKGDLTVQDLTLEVEAYKPGTFHFGPASIEGKAYKIDSAGQKIYFSNILKADAPGTDITVEPFPIKNEPASFNGTLARKLEGQIHLKTPDKVKVGELIELEMTVSGPLNLADMALPELKCQPGFSGFFQLDDLPPLATVEGDTKKFIIDMRAISSLIQAVPSIEISALDPERQEFIFWRSPEIPLKVFSQEKKREINFVPLLPTEEDIGTVIKKYDISLPPIQNYETVEVNLNELNQSWTETYWVLLCIPLFALGWVVQWKIHRSWMQKQQQIKKKNSLQVLEDALKGEDAILVLPGIKKAFAVLFEESGFTMDEKLKLFLDRLDFLMYGKDREVDLNEIKKEALKLYKRK